MNPRHITPERRAAAVADYRTSGDTYAAVSKRHGVSAAALNSWVICLRRRVQVWEAA